jgi:hypothetical protein
MDTRKHLQAIAASMMGTASGIAVEHELTPTLILQVVDQPVMMPLGTEPLSMEDRASKDRTFRILRGLVCTLQPTAMGIAIESWFAESDPDNPDMTPPSERPDRKEGILIVAQNRADTLVVTREIIRKEGQPTELGEIHTASRVEMGIDFYRVEPMAQDEAEIVGFMADSIKRAIAADARGEGPPN